MTTAIRQLRLQGDVPRYDISIDVVSYVMFDCSLRSRKKHSLSYISQQVALMMYDDAETR